MDLHDVYEHARRLVLGVDLAAGDDRTVHHCACGYRTELLEVMAIHQVRAHQFPYNLAWRELNLEAIDRRLDQMNRSLGARAVCKVDGKRVSLALYESDSPDGPWTRAAVPWASKRYIRWVAEE